MFWALLRRPGLRWPRKRAATGRCCGDVDHGPRGRHIRKQGVSQKLCDGDGDGLRGVVAGVVLDLDDHLVDVVAIGAAGVGRGFEVRSRGEAQRAVRRDRESELRKIGCNRVDFIGLFGRAWKPIARFGLGADYRAAEMSFGWSGREAVECARSARSSRRGHRR